MIGDRWGVSESEALRTYQCDDFVVSPAMQAWRGVRVEAPAGAVWPWVAQIRLAPYSYDWIDNRGRRSPRDLAGLAEPRVGERFTTAGGRELGRIVSADPGEQLTGSIMGAFMSYVLVPAEHGATRLLLKVVMRTACWAAPLLSVGDLIMARRQLLNFKQLAERHQHQAATTVRMPAQSPAKPGAAGQRRFLRQMPCSAARVGLKRSPPSGRPGRYPVHGAAAPVRYRSGLKKRQRPRRV